MYIFIAFLMAFAVFAYKKFTVHRDQLTLTTFAGIIFSISLFILHYHLSRWVIPFFYVWMEIIIILSAIQFWIIAGEVFNPRQAKRTFPLIISGGSFAAIIAGYGIKPFINHYGSDNLLFITISFLLFGALIGRLIRPYRVPTKTIVINSQPYPKIKKIKFDTYIIAIALMVACSAFLSRSVDYQFKMFAVSIYPTQDTLVNFFANYYITTGIATLIMQLFITGMVLQKWGVLIGLLILPISLLLGSVGFIMSGSLLAVFITKFSDQVFKFSIYNSVREILWLPLSPKKIREVKPNIDGTIRACVEGFAGLLIFLLVSFNLLPEPKLYILSIISIFGIAFWIWIVVDLKNGYIQSVINSIENRRLNLDKIEYDVTDASTVSTLDIALKSKDELKQLFALDLLWKLSLDPWKKTIKSLFSNGSTAIKRGVIELAWNKEDILPNKLILNQIEKQEDITPYAIICASDRKINNIAEKLCPLLNSKDKKIRLATAVTLLTDNINHNEAKTLINKVLFENNEDEILLFIGFAKSSPNILNKDIIINFLEADSIDINNAILIHLTNYPDVIFLDKILDLFENPATVMNARKTLLKIQGGNVVKKLVSIINNKKSNPKIRKEILEIIHHFHHDSLIETLMDLMDDPEMSILNEVSNSLLKISKIQKLNKIDLIKIDEKIRILSQRAFQLHLFNDSLINDSHSQLIKDHIDDDLTILISILLRLGTIKEPDIPIEMYIRYINSNDSNLLPLVLELVESTFSKTAARFTIPLIDPETNPVKICQEIFNDKFLSKSDMLLYWANNPHYWKTCIAIHYCILKEKVSVLKKINWESISNKLFGNNYLTKSEEEYLNRNFFHNKIINDKSKIMYSILEKTLLLKSVELFENIPGSILAKIAQISSEVQLESDEIIFNEGDDGQSLYIIISGKINLIQNNILITSLEKGNCIGEMALLDQNPRSAGAIANEETILLKIDQLGFYELLAGNADIMKQIVKILAKRLRKMNKKLTNDLR